MSRRSGVRGAGLFGRGNSDEAGRRHDFGRMVAGCLTSADYGAENGPRELVAMVRDQLMRCWAPPAETGVPLVKVRFGLNQDGTLARDPVALPVNSGDLQNAQFQPAAKSALRAVRACTPLRLPAARYDMWNEMEVVFDPRPHSNPGEVRR